jgi:hypothetical protein
MRTTSGRSDRTASTAARVARLADDRDRLVARDDRAEARPHQVVVDDEEHANRAAAHPPSP